MTDKDIRTLIRDGLAARDWTVADLHRALIRAGCDCSDDVLYRYLDGRTQIGADTLEAVLGVLGLTVAPKKSQKS